MGAAALAEVFQVEDVAEAKAADTGERGRLVEVDNGEATVLDVHAEERRDQRGEGAGADGKVGS